MRYVLFFAILVGAGFQTLPAHVEAFDITPGKWRFEYESRASFQPQPQTRTDTQCVTEPNWDPTASITKSSDCRLSNTAQDTTSFSGTLTCSRGQGNPPMTGSISYTSTGTSLTGRTAFKGEGYEMEMKTSGTRIGECD